MSKTLSRRDSYLPDFNVQTQQGIKAISTWMPAGEVEDNKKKQKRTFLASRIHMVAVNEIPKLVKKGHSDCTMHYFIGHLTCQSCPPPSFKNATKYVPF